MGVGGVFRSPDVQLRVTSLYMEKSWRRSSRQ